MPKIDQADFKTESLLQCYCGEDPEQRRQIFEDVMAAHAAARGTLQFNMPHMCPRMIMRSMVDILCLEMLSQQQFAKQVDEVKMPEIDRKKWITDPRKVFEQIENLIESRYAEVSRMLIEEGYDI